MMNQVLLLFFVASRVKGSGYRVLGFGVLLLLFVASRVKGLGFRV